MEAAVVEVDTGAVRTPVGALPGVKAFVQFEMDKLGEASWTQFAQEGPLA